jgi:putative acetyltransferase
MSTVQIRPAHDADSPGVIRLIGDCYAEYPGCVLDVEEEERQLQSVASHFAAGDGGFWVAENGGEEIVGSVGYLPFGGGLKLHHLYVAAAHRGGGLAGRLFDLVREAAVRSSASEIVCWSDTRFTRAHGFYEKLGFHRGPMLRHLGDRSLSVEFFFRLRLDSA